MLLIIHPHDFLTDIIPALRQFPYTLCDRDDQPQTKRSSLRGMTELKSVSPKAASMEDRLQCSQGRQRMGDTDASKSFTGISNIITLC